MARQGFCRTGQAAKVWGLSSHQVRRICETGLVVAELGPGGHWRIPVSEVVRLQKDGVPLIPSAVDDRQREGSESEHKSGGMIKVSPRHDLLAPPSRTVVASDEEGPITSNYLEQPKIAKATESETGWFRDRTRQQGASQAAAAQALINQRSNAGSVRPRAMALPLARMGFTVSTMGCACRVSPRREAGGREDTPESPAPDSGIVDAQAC
jgi:hypothetical protein